MDQQTSFIPKKPIAKDGMAMREAPIGIFMLLATLVFFGSLFAGTGVFFYKMLLAKEIKTMSAALDRAERAFEPSLIVELERLDKRIESSKEILASHTVISPLFALLESSTIPNIRFNKFTYTFTGPEKIELVMSGQARSYAYVAVQSDVFGGSKYFSDHIFSNLNLDSQGNVTFDFFASVDRALVHYKDVIAREGVASE